MKKLSFPLVMLLLTLAVIEMMALFSDRLLHAKPASFEASAPGPRWAAPTAKAVLHPFFGHVPRRWQTLNIMPPPPRREGTFVIALLGGSVAKDVAVELRNALFHAFFESNLDRARTRTPNGVAPILVDLTNTGSHQPFQAVALANMIANDGQFDAVVVVDGYNEIADVPNHLSLGLYPLFPRFWSNLTKVTPAQRTIVGRIEMLRRQQRNLLRGGAMDFLQHSAVFRLIRHFRLDRIDRLLVLAHHELTAASMSVYDLEKHGPHGVYAEEERGEIGTESWYRGALLLAQLAERHGAEYYHFLQPNQHVPDTKELSRREVALARQTTYESREVVRQGYPLLRQYGRLLRDQNFKFFDLSWIYKDHPETFYIDPCCHVNKRGNELLAEAIVSRIVAERGVADGVRSLTPVARGAFDVYDLGTYLAYAKVPCQLADTSGPFFLQATDGRKSMAKLPVSQPVEDHQFEFRYQGAVFDDLCVTNVALGDWHNATIHTGQLAGDDTPAWSVSFVHSRGH